MSIILEVVSIVLAAVSVVLAARVGNLSGVMVHPFSVMSVVAIVVGIVFSVHVGFLWAPASGFTSAGSTRFNLGVLAKIWLVVVALIEFIELIEEGSWLDG